MWIFVRPIGYPTSKQGRPLYAMLLYVLCMSTFKTFVEADIILQAYVEGSHSHLGLGVKLHPDGKRTIAVHTGIPAAQV